MHEAAFNGHLAICQFIMDKFDGKDPKANQGKTMTPLHIEIRVGHAQ